MKTKLAILQDEKAVAIEMQQITLDANKSKDYMYYKGYERAIAHAIGIIECKKVTRESNHKEIRKQIHETVLYTY